MPKKITSYNQSGGITAEKVHVENNVNAPNINVEQLETAQKKKKTAWAKVIAFLVATATILSGVIALLQYLGIGGKP